MNTVQFRKIFYSGEGFSKKRNLEARAIPCLNGKARRALRVTRRVKRYPSVPNKKPGIAAGLSNF
jgi:hypothetical protein